MHIGGGDRITGLPFASRSEVMATHGMAATSQPLATQAALEILRRDGTAVDAAIAANAVLAVVEPTGCGIGGDLFAMVWDAQDSRLHGLNASGRSPRSLTRQWLIENGHTHLPERGPLSVSVPGAVDGWFMLHERFGRRPMSEVLAAAMCHAREGFPVSEVIAHEWAEVFDELCCWPGFSDQFGIDGRAPHKGELWRNPNLADSLERIAVSGRDGFYRGDVARTMSTYVQANGGFLDLDDLATHYGEWVQPLSTAYRGVDVWELPPNGQGIAALQMLNILEGHDLATAGFGSAEHIHLMVEAKKLAFEDRARYYADPYFARLPVDRLVSKSYAAERYRQIDPERASHRPLAGQFAPPGGDTVYLSVADRHGNMVSLIQSIFRGMGSGMTPPGLGFVLQNRGELFSLDADHANVYEPGKRPFHTIIPGFLSRGGQPWISFGVMGGDMQPQAHAQIVSNLVDFGMNLQEAGDAPRIGHSGSSTPTGLAGDGGGFVHLESGFPPATGAELEHMGHRIRPSPGSFGGYQAILRDPDNGCYIGASDLRKDGQAAGF